MSQMSNAIDATADTHTAAGFLFRFFVIALTAFLTVVDLFATQAILPSLAQHYGVSAGAMGFAVNACTIGMAIAGLGVAYFSPHIDRRRGILIALIVLAIPTSLLASAPNLTIFTLLRIVQGLCMASAFTLTLAYLGENTSPGETASVFAAYITGNVASNLIGRLLSAGVADHFGLSWNFYFFALLNLCGAVLVYFTVHKAPPMSDMGKQARSPFAAWVTHLKNPALRAAFGIAFCILFAFIGTFTYVNFVLIGEPFSVGGMMLGFVYLVFLPSILTTPPRRPRGAVARHPPDHVVLPSARGLGIAVDAYAQSHGGADRNGAGRGRHLLCAGDGDRICRARGDGRSRRRERHLSRLLLLRRPDRQRGARPVLRQVRLTPPSPELRCHS